MKQKYAKELKRLTRSGELRPSEVVKAASEPSNPLHECFTWDDEAAAHQHRLEEARSLIRSYKVHIEIHEVVVEIKGYVRNVDVVTNVEGYRMSREVKDDPGSGRRTLYSSIKGPLTLLTNLRNLATSWDMQAEAELLDQAIATLAKLSKLCESNRKGAAA